MYLTNPGMMKDSVLSTLRRVFKSREYIEMPSSETRHFLPSKTAIFVGTSCASRAFLIPRIISNRASFETRQYSAMESIMLSAESESQSRNSLKSLRSCAKTDFSSHTCRRSNPKSIIKENTLVGSSMNSSRDSLSNTALNLDSEPPLLLRSIELTPHPSPIAQTGQ